MAVSWKLIETKQEENGRWYSVVEFNLNGEIIKRSLNWNNNKPASGNITTIASQIASQLQIQSQIQKISFSSNDTETNNDYINIIKEGILQIRINSNITQNEFENMLVLKFPDNIFNIKNLIKKICNQAKVVNFTELKIFVLNNTFEII